VFQVPDGESCWICTGVPGSFGRIVPATLEVSATIARLTAGATASFVSGVVTVPLVTRYSTGALALRRTENDPSGAGRTAPAGAQMPEGAVLCSGRRPGMLRPRPVSANGEP